MKVTVVSGSRADYGMLEWPVKVLQADPFFDVSVLKIWEHSLPEAFRKLTGIETDLVLILGDRYEILGAATAAHLQRIPIAHIGGGDVTEGSYDDAMRDSISRMASIHFVTSTSAMARLTHMGFRNVHLVGSPGIDYIRHADWKKPRWIEKPYVVVSYQPETIDGTNEIDKILQSLPQDKLAVFMLPNPDKGGDEISQAIYAYCHGKDSFWQGYYPHDQFLSLLSYCDEFIGNSSAMLYEAPELGVKVRMIGKRQRGRVIPWSDGYASERIAKILKYTHL